MWTISWILFWTILDKVTSQIMIEKEGEIGKYTTKSILVAINEPKTSNNSKVQRVHECIKYERDQLTKIALKCKHDKHLKITNKDTCAKIRECRLNRRYKRGGKRLETTFRKSEQQYNTFNKSNLINISCNDKGSDRSRDDIQIALINAQSLRIKELLLYDYIKQNSIDLCIVKCGVIHRHSTMTTWCYTT